MVAGSTLLRASVSEVSRVLAAVTVWPCAGGRSALLDLSRFDRPVCVTVEPIWC